MSNVKNYIRTFKQQDGDVVKDFALMPKEGAEQYAAALIFFSNMVDKNGKPRNPKNLAHRKAAEKLKNLRILNRSSKIPEMQEQNQIMIASEDAKK